MKTTQTNSRPKIKNDKFNNDTITTLYQQFNELNDVDFRNYCIKLVESGRGKTFNIKKVCMSLQTVTNKNIILKKTQDFILKGMGLGV